jgi:hypothetical protein
LLKLNKGDVRNWLKLGGDNKSFQGKAIPVRRFNEKFSQS